jgi:hypothetical protein
VAGVTLLISDHVIHAIIKRIRVWSISDNSDHSAIVGDVVTDIPQQKTPVEDDAKNRKQLLFILCVLNSVLLSDASFKTAIRSETLTLDPQSKCVAHLFLSIYYDILPLISQTLKLTY